MSRGMGPPFYTWSPLSPNHHSGRLSPLPFPSFLKFSSFPNDYVAKTLFSLIPSLIILKVHRKMLSCDIQNQRNFLFNILTD